MGKATEERRKAAGLCIDCNQTNDQLPSVRCSKCAAKHNESGKRYYSHNKSKILEHTHAYYAANAKKHKVLTDAWWVNHPGMSSKYRAKMKLRAFQKISGQECPVCVYCGCDDPRFLEVNHKNGGGAKEYWTKRNSRATSSGFNFYNEVVQGRRKVDDLEVTCRPHNAWHFLKLKHGADADRFQIIWKPAVE